jgi:hypothetical protein
LTGHPPDPQKPNRNGIIRPQPDLTEHVPEGRVAVLADERPQDSETRKSTFRRHENRADFEAMTQSCRFLAVVGFPGISAEYESVGHEAS